MNFEKLQELLNILEYSSDRFTVSNIVVNIDCADVYFKNGNRKAMLFLEASWGFKCEMHDSNDSYVRFNF